MHTHESSRYKKSAKSSFECNIETPMVQSDCVCDQ